MLTECLPASSTVSEDPVRDLANDPAQESPSRDWTGHNNVHQTQISKESDSFGSPPQREQCHYKADVELKQRVALLLTELEVRVLSPVEAQEFSRTTGEGLQTLTISPQTKEVSEAQLSDRPLLVLLREEETVREAYRRLRSLLESSKPMPKPRIKSPLHSVRQSSLLEALRRGIETGDRVLTLQHSTEIKTISNVQQNSMNTTIKPSGSASSFDSLSDQSQRKLREDIRHSTYRRLDSLEETIRELENTLIEIGGHPAVDPLYSEATTKSSPVQMTGSPTSENRKPPVPPKPSSPASIQVQFLHLLCRFLLWSNMLYFLSSLLLSGWLLEFHFQASDVCSLTKSASICNWNWKCAVGVRQRTSFLLVCSVISVGAAIPLLLTIWSSEIYFLSVIKKKYMHR